MKIANVLEIDADADLLRPATKKPIFHTDLLLKFWFVLNLLGVIWWTTSLQRKKSSNYKYAKQKTEKSFMNF